MGKILHRPDEAKLERQLMVKCHHMVAEAEHPSVDARDLELPWIAEEVSIGERAHQLMDALQARDVSWGSTYQQVRDWMNAQPRPALAAQCATVGHEAEWDFN